MNGDGTIETRLTKAGYAASIALLCSLTANAASAQTPQTGGPTPSSQGAEVYFFDLKDGATVPSKFKINFGLRNMGVAPAGSDRANSGHHHVLVDTELPPLNQPIPNDFNHLHFGSGQTEAEIALQPGEHTLQLLMGDKDHIPHTPPVMSQRIRVRVAGAAAPAPGATAAPSTRKPSPKDARVYFVGVENGSVIRPQVTIRFGLANMGIAPAGTDKPNTGHHHMLVDAKVPDLNSPIPNDFNHLHFGAGQTEATVTLPLGKHSLRLLFADENHVPHDPVVMSEEISVVVTEKEPERAVKRKSYKSQRSYRSEGSYRSYRSDGYRSYRSYRSYGGHHSRW